MSNLKKRDEMTTKDELQLMCDAYAEDVDNGKFIKDLKSDDYASVLDHRYVIDYDGAYRSVHLLVAFGGPNIWICTDTMEVNGYWGSDRVTSWFGRSASDEIDDFYEDLYNGHLLTVRTY